MIQLIFSALLISGSAQAEPPNPKLRYDFQSSDVVYITDELADAPELVLTSAQPSAQAIIRCAYVRHGSIDFNVTYLGGRSREIQVTLMDYAFGTVGIFSQSRIDRDDCPNFLDSVQKAISQQPLHLEFDLSNETVVFPD